MRRPGRAAATSGSVHSVRLPGLVAHQEVIFGGVGQISPSATIPSTAHSFMPGSMLAARRIRGHKGLIIGLENLL